MDYLHEMDLTERAMDCRMSAIGLWTISWESLGNPDDSNTSHESYLDITHTKRQETGWFNYMNRDIEKLMTSYTDFSIHFKRPYVTIIESIWKRDYSTPKK